jgi:hypothetical protein
LKPRQSGFHKSSQIESRFFLYVRGVWLALPDRKKSEHFMRTTPAKLLGKGLNLALNPLGVQLVRSHDWDDVEQFLPLEQTLSDARKAGLTVSDYVDATYNVAGATQQTIDQLAYMGVFATPIDVIAEIGPGSGRYLEKVLQLCDSSRYEIYETAGPWANYLTTTYGVVSHPTDGYSMPHTATNSVDLVHAQKVFVATSFMTTCHYWLEMIRVARANAYIVFDIITEGCMDAKNLQHWLASTAFMRGVYPSIVPRDFAVEFFANRGIALVGSFFVPMKPGKTETFVFRKRQTS